MTENTLTQLNHSISNLKIERDNLLGDVIQDRQQMSLIQKELNELTRRYEERSGALREKEQILRDYEKMINDSENAYKKLVENSSKLLYALESESTMLQDKIRNKNKTSFKS